MQRSEDINKESTKQKLTLGIDKNVIERAKVAGINISAITEQVLKAKTYNDESTRDDVVRAYQTLFEMAQSCMSKYGGSDFQICVGEKQLTKVLLDSEYGLLLVNDHDMIDDNSSVDRVLELLYDPLKILENLIVSLTRRAEENKEKLAELKFALRLVKGLSDDE
jgi:hypothetical protein